MDTTGIGMQAEEDKQQWLQDQEVLQVLSRDIGKASLVDQHCLLLSVCHGFCIASNVPQPYGHALKTARSAGIKPTFMGGISPRNAQVARLDYSDASIADCRDKLINVQIIREI